MSKAKPYKACPKCGCNLDWGEQCDCEARQEAAAEAAQSAAQPVTAKEARKNWRGPVLMPGA